MSKKNTNTIFGKKRSKLSVLPVIFSGILAAGTMAATGVSIWHVSKNYQESSEFKKSYNARINVNPVGFSGEIKTEKAKAEANLKESASRLSAWLKLNGAESYDVSYELTDPDASGSYEKSGWLSANFTVSKVVKKHVTSEKDEKIDNDPYLSYFASEGFNTNNRTLVYRWYDPSETSRADPRYTLLDFKDAFEMPTNLSAKDNGTKSLTDKDGKSGVLLKINGSAKQQLSEFYKDMKQAYKDTQDDPKGNKKTIDAWRKPAIYIINNIEQLFNEVNYHMLNYGAYSDKTNEMTPSQYYRNIYDNTDYQKFAQTVSEHSHMHETRGTKVYKLGEAYIKDSSDVIENGEALNYIDYSKYGNVEHSFLNKYVDKIYKFEEKDYEKFFPDKITDTYTNDEASTKENPSLNYAWFATTSTNAADDYLSKQVDKNLKCKIVSIDVKSEQSPEKILSTIYKPSFTSREVPPKFIETIFAGSNIIGVLSLGFLLFLIALLIILALLYRTTGVMSWICMMFMLSMTGLISLAGTATITMSFLFGMFAMSLFGFIAALAICGRIKRRICCNEDTSVAVIKGLKKSLWPIVDISFIALMFGICFTYIAPMNLNSLGISMIVGGFATFICMYLINGLLMLLFFNNGLTMNKFIFLGRPNNKANEALAQSNSNVPTSMDATKLELAFYDRFSKTKFGLFDWKSLVVLGVLAALMIAGIVMFSINGLSSGTLFHSSMCIVVTNNDPSIIDVAAELQAKGLTYSSVTRIGNYWYFYCDVPSDSVIASIRTMIGDWKNNSTVTFGHIVGNTNKDILNFAMISMIISVSAISVYTCLRSNWSAFVPMLAGSILVPLLILGLASIAQIKFDQNVVLGFVLCVAVNTLMSNTLLAATNDAWFRKESYDKEELKFIVTASIKNSLKYIILITGAFLLFIAFFAVCSPKGLSSLPWIMLIGALCSALVTPLVVSTILYYFLIIRSKALTRRANRLSNKVVVNMDEIDEQAIEGINKFTKSRAYAKKQTGVNNEQR